MAISPTEAHYIIESSLHDFRIDGRSRLEHRPYSISTKSNSCPNNSSNPVVSSLVLSNGSSRIHLPGSSTDILCSVKADLVRPSPTKPNEGVVEISVDSSLAGGGSDMTVNAASSTGNKNSSMQKRQLRERESTITSFLTRLVVPHAVDYRGLVISPGKYVWRLCVDIVILRCDGCVLDACAMAVREGLRSTLLPRVSAVGGRSNDGKGGAFRGGGGSSNNDLIVEGDIRKALPPPGSEECPLVVTLSILSAPQDERIRHFCIVDARTEEEVCASSRVCVSVDPNGMVCGVHTLGGGGIDDEAMNDEFGVEGFGISSSSMPMNMLNEVVNTAAGAAKNLYRLLDSERIAGDSKAKDDGSGYGYLLQNQLMIQ